MVLLHAQDADNALEPAESHESVEEIIVQATRSRRRVQDTPTRVEILGLEEISEKILMRPGNISMMLAETGGLRVQVTSAALGASNIRVHGMRGRYTQLLADGLPLYGGQASALGLLQVPPSDLGQVEVIKGAASALYGGQALGGVINLISKRPGDEANGELIVNATTRNGQDVSTYLAAPIGDGWSGSVLLTGNQQSAQDLDDDGWIDMPQYDRWSARPRLFWAGSDGSTAYLTMGAMQEERRGGTRGLRLVPNGNPFIQQQDTRRVDAGMVLDRPLGDQMRGQVRTAAVRQTHDHLFGGVLEKDRHQTVLGEASVAGDSARLSWVTGMAYQTDRYDADAFPVHDYRYKAPAVFAHVDWDVSEQVTSAISARWDDHSEYGAAFSPRLAVLYRPGAWSIRGSWGRGFYAPTPFLEETEAAGLARLEVLTDLRAETAETASVDFAYQSGGLETGLTFFASDIDHAVRIRPVAPDRVQMVNIAGITRTRGVEALLRWRRDALVVTASYLYTDASEPAISGTGRRLVPLTPRHSAGMVAMWEVEGRGRVGLEIYYTGSQPLEDNPFRDEGDPYFQVGLLGEVVRGRLAFFLNLENVLNVRQTREDLLVRPERTADGRWTVDAWAPLDGFVANAGVRLRLGG